VLFGLLEVVFERGDQLLRIRGLHHLRESLGDPVLGVVDVLHLVDEQVPEGLRHVVLLVMFAGVRRQRARTAPARASAEADGRVRQLKGS